jgi:hypothetical protein
VEVLIVGRNQRADGTRYDGKICDECIADCLLMIAQVDLQKFDQMVREARKSAAPKAS